MKKIRSYSEWVEMMKQHATLFLFLYRKGGSAVNRCAFDNLEQAVGSVRDVEVVYADVEETRDIHPHYPVNSVPVLLEFRNGELKNILKGCHDATLYSNQFEDRRASGSPEAAEGSAYRVTVYSTPTCSWCTTLKNYLRKNRISFTDIDVSRDQEAAREMVSRSGQQGVPQSVINGEVIVGFNKARIDQLLGSR